jgi:hypothetical protein
MSATRRGAKRRPNDFYETPVWLTEAMLPHLVRYQPRRILEPAVGDGAIARVLKRAFPDARLVVGDVGTGQDFLSHDHGGPFDLIMTNPPYSQALEFVTRALTFRAETGAVVMLLRLNWLGSQERAPWLRGHTPSVYVTPRHPDFTGGGGDATDYGWLVWDAGPPTVVILDTEQRDSRTRPLFPVVSDNHVALAQS